MAVYSDGLAKLRENLEWFLQSGVDTSIIGKTKEPISIEKPRGIVSRPEKIYVPEDDDVDENTIQKELKERALDNWGKIFSESQAAAISSASTKKNKKQKTIIVDETMDSSQVSKVKEEIQKRPGEPIANIITNQQMTEGYPGRSGGAYQRSFFGDKVKGSPKKESLVKKPVVTLDSDIPEGRGINERATDPVYEVQGSVFTDEVLGPNEGTISGDIITGLATAEYGVQNSLGLKRQDFSSNRTFASSVVEKHYESLNEKFAKGGHDLKSMPKEVQYAFLDLHYNNGNVGNDTVDFFDPKEITKSLNNTLEFVGTRRNNGEKILLPSLASRRVNMYNKAIESVGKRNNKIYSIEITKENSEFGKNNLVQYRDVLGNIIHSFTNSRKLANVSNSGATIERQSATWSAKNNTWSYE